MRNVPRIIMILFNKISSDFLDKENFIHNRDLKINVWCAHTFVKNTYQSRLISILETNAIFTLKIIQE